MIKAADIVNRLGSLLELNRKAILEGKSPILTDEEQSMATQWAGKLWGLSPCVSQRPDPYDGR